MENKKTKTVAALDKKNGFRSILRSDMKRNRMLYLMVIPVILFYAIFHYAPMYGAIIAFQNFKPHLGVGGSEWVGFANFTDFFNSYYFIRVLRNTLIISVASLVFGFPAPIILALLINELHSRKFSRVVQTVTYMPHFISLVVICGIIREFTRNDGIVSVFLSFFGFTPLTMLNKPELFVPVYVVSGIWQEIGWGSIIYLAAIMGIDPQLYEAAKLDGAGTFKQILHVTLPGITGVIIVLLILRIGQLLNVGFEKIILLYNPTIYETSDVISSFVYRKGLIDLNWSYAAAIGLFNSAVNFILLLSANKISKKAQGTGLW